MNLHVSLTRPAAHAAAARLAGLLAAVVAVAVLAAPAASAQPLFFFIHVPGSDTNVTQDQIDAGLQEIGDILSANWSAGHGGQTPRICWVGYGGPWEAGGTNQPNHAATASNPSWAPKSR